MRYIPIKSCGDCPHRGHSGGFGIPAYKPVCRKESKTLPYTEEVHRGHVVATQKPGIPSWCPLEDR